MNPILIGTLAAGALCALAIVVSLIRRAVQVHRLRRRPFVYHPDFRAWIPDDQRRLEDARRGHVGKELS